ncbi:hypothetical protein SEHO0A_02818 [Salmonella enterica subsp. houtenae str. ATCC BAA-1581]|nr:hypothetical protein SEHO0A_02818 [Salmonella enterica subsp. houtenae str. ATCC BAA-1581]ENZ85798.1 hypothetical protein D088_670045 [Salmonella enterica subsp. houtenae serovar 16:z4,z32:-- str. RKS3027]
MPALLTTLSPDRESYCKIPFMFSYNQIFVVERLPFSLLNDNNYH